MTTRSGASSSLSASTCSSCNDTSKSSSRYPARVAKPNGGKREYLTGLKKGLLASVKAGRIIFILIIQASLAFSRVNRSQKLRSTSALIMSSALYNKVHYNARPDDNNGQAAVVSFKKA